MTDAIYQELARLSTAQETAAFCVITNAKGSTPRGTGSKMIVYPDGSIMGTVGGGVLEQRVVAAAQEAMQSRKPIVVSYEMNDPKKGDPGVCGGQVEVYVEPILPKPAVVVIGAGHVGKAVVELAKWLDFHVVVSDDRPDFASEDETPDADVIHTGLMETLPDEFNIHSQTYFVLTTRDAGIDAVGLPKLMATPAPYIGVIGSRRRWATTRKQMEAQGVDPAEIDRIVSPVGLELQAETPAEIAVSIMAQIILLHRAGELDAHPEKMAS